MGVRITRRRLSLAAAYRTLPDARSGGVAVFVGRSRSEEGSRTPVTALDYEADERLAVKVLQEIEATAKARYGARRTVVWHRVGRVPVGEPSVIVGAAAPHRAEAFAAARFLIDSLKAEAPIWKAVRSRPGRRRPGRRGRRAGRSTD